MPQQEYRVVIYQMMTRLFGNNVLNNTPWGTIEENGVGKFSDITQIALKILKEQGYTHIWYTGIIEHALLTDYTRYGIELDDADIVKGRAGSPYAIKDYYDVNPDLANHVPDRIAEFEQLIHRSHKAGLNVVIDFIPNHVARNYYSDAKPTDALDFGTNDQTDRFEANNNFYYLPQTSFIVPKDYQLSENHSIKKKNGFFKESPAKASGNNIFVHNPAINDWFETIKLNYGIDFQNEATKHFDPIPDTWIKMRDILLYWANKGVDGFRCDMAEMVPVEFWDWVIGEVKKKYPNQLFIAEIYNPNVYREYIFSGGFDYLYDKVELYDTLKHIIQGKATTDELTTIWQKQEGIGSHMLRFLENHDEQRIASPHFAGNARKGIPMMAATAFMHNGPIMMYFGQDVGEPAHGNSGFSNDNGRTTIFDYWGVPEHIKWMSDGAFNGKQLSTDQKQLQTQYQEILLACHQYKALRIGGFYDLHFFNRNEQYQGYSNQVYTFLRHSDDQSILIAINFSDKEETSKIKIPPDAWDKLNINSDRVIVGTTILSKSSTLTYGGDSELVLTLPALNYVIVPIKKYQNENN